MTRFAAGAGAAGAGDAGGVEFFFWRVTEVPAKWE